MIYKNVYDTSSVFKLNGGRVERLEPLVSLKATSHSTIFDIPMRPVREDQRHRRRFTP